MQQWQRQPENRVVQIMRCGPTMRLATTLVHGVENTMVKQRGETPNPEPLLTIGYVLLCVWLSRVLRFLEANDNWVNQSIAM